MEINMIDLQNLSVNFIEGNNTLLAVNNINVKLSCNEFVSIIGRSGSGKSTTLNVIGGLLQPTCGQVVVDGENIYSYNEKQLANYRRQSVGFIFQSFNLEEMYTVYQNIEIALMISNYPKEKRKERIDELIDQVGLSSKRDTQVKKLSGGEKQRVCIARAIANKPKIILADEPCGNLDTNNGLIVMELLRKLVSKKQLLFL